MRIDVIQASYVAAAVLFILGLRGMSSPKTARNGIICQPGTLVRLDDGRMHRCQ